MSTLNLYNCGGLGANIGSQFTKYNNKPTSGFAEINTIFIDTSKSNLNPNIPQDMVYLVDDLDGSGKKRDSNYTVLSECSKEILHKFKPADLNVVLHSCSGGSGSVIGPILVSEMLSRGETVVVVLVGSTSSRIEAENTLKTLKSYEMISRKRDMPVIAYYRENSIEKPRGYVDSEIQTAIVLLAAIFSGNNRELDSSDLNNFLNYNKVTSYSPKLSMLDFFSKDILISRGQSLVSLVSLVDEKTSHEITIPTEYQATGFLPEVTKEAIPEQLPIHACIIAGYFNSIAQNLEEKLKVFDDARKCVIEKSIISDNHHSTDDGLIL